MYHKRPSGDLDSVLKNVVVNDLILKELNLFCIKHIQQICMTALMDTMY